MKFRRTRFTMFSGFLLDLGKLFAQLDTLEQTNGTANMF